MSNLPSDGMLSFRKAGLPSLAASVAIAIAVILVSGCGGEAETPAKALADKPPASSLEPETKGKAAPGGRVKADTTSRRELKKSKRAAGD